MKHRNGDQQFLRGIEQFNRGDFFGAHETWEEIWLHAAPPKKNFLQGLIQVAAAFDHYRRGKPAGTLSLLRAGLKRLAGFSPTYCGIRLEELQQAVARWIGSLARGQQPRPEELPKIELQK